MPLAELRAFVRNIQEERPLVEGNSGVNEEDNHAGISYQGSEEAAEQSLKNLSSCTDCERCTNCHRCKNCKNCQRCTNCMDCHGCTDCYGCMNCMDCHGCTNCYGCTDCHGCTNALFCCNLDGDSKKYYIANVEVTKEEFKRKERELGL